MQLDYAAIMRGGQSLVPDLRAQMMEEALFDLKKRQVSQDEAVLNAKLAEAQRETDLVAGYERDLQAALLEGTPQAIRRLQTKYPSLTKDAKEAFDAMDEDMKSGILTQMGAIHNRAINGDLAGAAAKLEQRIAADRAAGEDTAEDEEILAGLRSEDPAQQRIAVGMIAFSLRAIAGDKFDAVTKAMEPDKKTPDQLQYEYDLQLYGKAYADQAKLARDTKTIGLAPGGELGAFGPDPSLMGGGQQQGGGDPASGVGAGSTGSAPQRPVLTRDQFKANLDILGTQRAIGLLTNNGMRVQVRSPQEARSLPSGTPILLPDGREGVVP